MSTVWRTLRTYFSERAFSIPLLAGLVLAFSGELGQPTFHSDRFFEIWFRNNMLDYWTGYGRYLAKLIFLAMDRVYPPTLLLLVALGVLSCVGVFLCELWGVTGRARPVLVLILCTFPFFYETFSYVPSRYAVPLAIACAVLAIARGGLIGLILALSGLLLYQACVSVAAVVVLVWAATEALVGKPWRVCLRAIVVPRIGLLVLAIVLDTLMLRFVSAFLSPISLLDNHVINSMEQLRYSMTMQFQAMVSFFFERGVFLFPFWTKLIAVVGFLAIITGLCRKGVFWQNRIFVLVMICLLPFAAHGVDLCLAQPFPFLFERALLGYAVVYVGIFAIAVSSARTERGRAAITALFGLAAVGFVYQANVWHEYMELKNMADIDVARAISDRLKSDAQYRPGLPLVMVGTMTPADYLPYNRFSPHQGKIQSTIPDSIYARDWSKDRALMFFVPFVWPGAQEISIAEKNAKTRSAWPATDSVFVKDGVMTVVLSK